MELSMKNVKTSLYTAKPTEKTTTNITTKLTTNLTTKPAKDKKLVAKKTKITAAKKASNGGDASFTLNAQLSFPNGSGFAFCAPTSIVKDSKVGTEQLLVSLRETCVFLETMLKTQMGQQS